MLTCYRTRRRIGAYLDGALTPSDSEIAAAHIAGCARCQGEVDALRRLSAMLRRGLAAPAAPEWTGLWEGVRRGIEAPRLEPSRARPAVRWRPRFAMAAVAALAVIAAVVFWQIPRPFTSRADAAVLVNSADTDEPGGAVMVYTPPEKDLAVVWLFAEK